MCNQTASAFYLSHSAEPIRTYFFKRFRRAASILMVANTEFILNGLFPQTIKLIKLPFELYVPLAFMIDVASMLALIAVTVAAVRRLLSPPYPEARTLEAFFILGLMIGKKRLLFFFYLL